MAVPNDLISILLGQAQGVDPRGVFLGQALTRGTLPGDPISNLNTVLDLLGPSAGQDFLAQQRPVPETLQTLFQLAPQDAEQVVRQATGLSLSPVEQLSGQAAILGLLPDFQKAAAETEKAKAANTQAAAAKTRAGASASLAETAAEREKRLAKQAQQLTPEQRFEVNLKTIALTGQTLLGSPVPKEVQQNAFKIINRTSAVPGTAGLLGTLLKEGDFEGATTLLNKLGLEGVKIEKNFDLFNPLSGAPKLVPAEPQQTPTLDPQAAADEFLNALREAMGGLQ